MRLFIAVEFDSNIFRLIQNKIDTSNLKLKFTNTYHLTVKFLGEVSDEKVELIKRRLGEVKFSSFDVLLGDIGFFPNAHYVKVIWVGFFANDKINELQRKVDDALSELFSSEKRFHAHITLARVRDIFDKEKLSENINSIQFEKLKFNVNGFKLMKSNLTPEGPVYIELAEFKA